MDRTPFDRVRETDSLVLETVAAAQLDRRIDGGRWALAAVGGYGGGRLASFSDIDLTLIHRDLAAGQIGDLVKAIFYPLWDAGVELSHTVRTVKESVSFGKVDFHWLTSCLDARLISGDTELFSEFQERMVRLAAARGGRPFVREAANAAHERWREAGHSGRVREPDIKDGHGGLRDIQTVKWIGKVLPAWELGERDARLLADAEEFLWSVRMVLHSLSGRNLNKVQVELQPALAEHFFPAKDDAGFKLSRALYKALRDVAHITDAVLESVGHKCPGPAAGARASLTPDRLLEVLRLGAQGLPTLELWADSGALEELIPGWSGIQGLSFSDPNHRHPVDTHCFLTVGELVNLRVPAPNSKGLPARISEEIVHPDWLLWSGLFHDIGKGRQTPHSEAGADMLPDICRFLGLDRHAGETIGFLVRHHLLLSHVAARRDLDDPRVIEGVAAVIGDGDRLRMLYLLTLADAKATGPKAWNSWKAALVDELLLRTMEVLEGSSTLDGSSQVRFSEQHFDLLERDEEIVTAMWPENEGRSELAVVAPDRPGLISKIAGVLALNRINVLAAGFYTTDDGRALDVFKVAAAFESEVTDEMYERVKRDISRSLGGQMALSYHMDELTRRYQRPKGKGEAARVVLDNSASEEYTIVEVHAPDELGVLYEATGALAELNLDIHFAKVSTFGDRAVDAFYVSNLDGVKITEQAHLDEIEKNVLFRLSRFQNV